jgi:hypothetical protein
MAPSLYHYFLGKGHTCFGIQNPNYHHEKAVDDGISLPWTNIEYQRNWEVFGIFQPYDQKILGYIGGHVYDTPANTMVCQHW